MTLQSLAVWRFAQNLFIFLHFNWSFKVICENVRCEFIGRHHDGSIGYLSYNLCHKATVQAGATLSFIDWNETGPKAAILCTLFSKSGTSYLYKEKINLKNQAPLNCMKYIWIRYWESSPNSKVAYLPVGLGLNPGFGSLHKINQNYLDCNLS